MDSAKRKAIEAAGWKVGDAAELLEMSDEERRLLDKRVELAMGAQRAPHGDRTKNQDAVADGSGSNEINC